MKELKLNQRWSLPGLPFFNVTVQGAVKAVAVINIVTKKIIYHFIVRFTTPSWVHA